MTRQRHYNAQCPRCNVDALCPICHGAVSMATPFSDWLRSRAELGSSFGYTATNIDYVWSNYKTGRWMMLEEKRHGGGLSYAQSSIFLKMDELAKNSPNYNGFWILVFEKSSPEDGSIWLSRLSGQGRLVSKQELIKFLENCGITDE